MRLAYLISAYMDPDRLAKLIQALTYKENEFFIYIDGKVDKTPFKKAVGENEKVHFIEKTIKVFWGGFTQVLSISAMLHEALKYNFDRYTYISAQDYPVWSNQRLEKYFEENADRQLLYGFNVTQSNNKIALGKIDHYAHWDINIKHEKLFNKYRKILNNKVLKLFPHKTYYKDRNGQWDIYWGSDYWSMSAECAGYVDQVIHQNRGLRRYFKYVFCPSELWAQTIVANSKYRDTMVVDGKYDFNVATIMQLVDYTTSMYVWREKDYDKIIASDKMFIRKVATGISESLIEKIDQDRDK